MPSVTLARLSKAKSQKTSYPSFMAAGKRYAQWLDGNSATELSKLNYSTAHWQAIEEGHFVWGEDRRDGQVRPIPLQPDSYAANATGENADPDQGATQFPPHPHGHLIAEPYRELVGQPRVNQEIQADNALTTWNARANDRGASAYQDGWTKALAERAGRLGDQYVGTKTFGPNDELVTGYPVPEPGTVADEIEVTSKPTDADSVTEKPPKPTTRTAPS